MKAVQIPYYWWKFVLLFFKRRMGYPEWFKRERRINLRLDLWDQEGQPVPPFTEEELKTLREKG